MKKEERKDKYVNRYDYEDDINIALPSLSLLPFSISFFNILHKFYLYLPISLIERKFSEGVDLAHVFSDAEVRSAWHTAGNL
jgi:hypothetical protein